MKIVRKIEFTGKNLNDVFKLPCVNCIIKIDAVPWLVLDNRKMATTNMCQPGDTLVQYTDGTWDIEKKE